MAMSLPAHLVGSDLAGPMRRNFAAGHRVEGVPAVKTKRSFILFAALRGRRASALAL
jgi:hypothetical protein